MADEVVKHGVRPKSALHFAVAYHAPIGQRVAVVGNLAELGAWDVQRAVLMDTTAERFPLWDAHVAVDEGSLIEYKYIIVAPNGERLRLVRWESFERNRKVHAEGVKLAVRDGEFGQSTRHVSEGVDHGWIEGDWQLRLFFGSRDERPPVQPAITIFGVEAGSRRTFRPYVTPLNHRFFQPGFNPTKEGFAIVYTAPHSEELGVAVTIWETTDPKEKVKIGRAILTHRELAECGGTAVRPIIDGNLRVVGEVLMQYLVISPFHHMHNNLDNIKFYEWKPEVNVIGHRGFGASAKSFISENTLLSFRTAHRFGVKYVEFDVHVTSDGVPVIYHDFSIPTRAAPGVVVHTPISGLTLREFKHISSAGAASSHQRFKQATSVAEPPPRRLKRSTSLGPWALHEAALRWSIADASFCTLREVFEQLPSDVGFNVEIKYPHAPIERTVNARERNAFLEPILSTVFECAGKRPLFFSSFDPDVCVMLAKKQPRYPVFFLTEGHPDGDRPDDLRCTSVRKAAIFAAAGNLRGLVVDAKAILADLGVIHEVHMRNLLVFTYGADNNDPALVDVQKRAGVDVVISDKVTKISDAAAAPVNEIVERRLTLALLERQARASPKSRHRTLAEYEAERVRALRDEGDTLPSGATVSARPRTSEGEDEDASHDEGECEGEGEGEGEGVPETNQTV